MLDAKHLLWLAEIADLGSMSRAAQKLHVTQPTLTRAVQVVEDHVGGKVFEREPHGVRPTQIGERLVELGRQIALSRIQAEDTVDLWKEGLDKELRIGVGPMLAISFMGRFFAEMIDKPPKYSVKVVSATASRLIERLNMDELDVVLGPEHINLFHDDLVQSKLFDDRLAIFASSQNPLTRYQGNIPTETLSKQKWISVGALSGIFGSNKEVLSALGIRNLSAQISFTGDINMAIEVLEKTDCLCVLPRRLTENSEFADRVSALNVEGEFPTRNVNFWSRRKDRDRPDIVDFQKRLEASLLAMHD